MDPVYVGAQLANGKLEAHESFNRLRVRFVEVIASKQIEGRAGRTVRLHRTKRSDKGMS